MTRLTWPDIFLDASEFDSARLLGEWPGAVVGPIRPIGASAFGDIYFERPSGQIERLDVLEGGVHPVAGSFEEFRRQMNDPAWQESNLMTSGIAFLHERGVRRALGQFYAFAPHPAFSGRIDWNAVMPMDAAIWHSICSQSLGTEN